VGVELTAGDAITLMTGGGGGYGDPLSRDPDAVLNDVLHDYVTVQHAVAAYGVVIEGEKVNHQATIKMREKLRCRAT
jgi:N-methylhydantoinase B